MRWGAALLLLLLYSAAYSASLGLSFDFRSNEGVSSQASAVLVFSSGILTLRPFLLSSVE